MSRLHTINPAEATGQAAQLFAAIKGAVGKVPNAYAVIGSNAPEVLAHALQTGKPTITPKTTMPRRFHCERVGRRWPVRSNSSAAGKAATTARPKPTETGSKAATARRVAGSVRLKARTPSRPKMVPAFTAAESWEVDMIRSG